MTNEDFDKEIEDEKGVCALVDHNFKESLDYRKKYHHQFGENEKFYNGKHWPNGVKRPYKNHVFRIVESETPVLTDSRPGTEIVARNEEFEHGARLLQVAKSNVYRKQHLNLKDAMSIKDSLIIGTAFQYIDFDPDLCDGEGDVVVKNIPWKQVFPDPTANEVDECRYLGFKFPVDIKEVKRRFPKAKNIPLVSPDTFLNDNEEDDPFGEDQNFRDFGTSDGSKGRFESESLTTLEEMWIKDYSMDPIDDEETQLEISKESIELQQGIAPDITKYEDHQAHINGHKEQMYIIAAQALGVQPQEVTEDDINRLKEDEEIGLIFSIIDDHIEQHEMYLEAGFDRPEKPKYEDNMRVIIKVGKEILYDGPNPYADGMYPLAVFYCYKDGTSFWGTAEVTNLVPVQKSLNEMDWAEYSNLRLNGNSGWVVDNTSGVDESTLTNEPGLVVIKKQGTEARRLEPGQTSPQLSARREDDINSMLEISGVNEATMGEAPTGDPSGVAIKKLQQQAIGRIRLKSRMIEEYTLPKRDKLIISRIKKYYSTERKLRIDDDFGQVQFISYDPNEVHGIEEEIIVSPGTSAGLDKEAVFTLMGQLAQQGVIDPSTFVKLTDLPHKGKLLQAIAENDQTAAQLQQLQLENIQLKAQFAPDSLTEDEIALLQQQESQ